MENLGLRRYDVDPGERFVGLALVFRLGTLPCPPGRVGHGLERPHQPAGRVLRSTLLAVGATPLAVSTRLFVVIVVSLYFADPGAGTDAGVDAERAHLVVGVPDLGREGATVVDVDRVRTVQRCVVETAGSCPCSYRGWPSSSGTTYGRRVPSSRGSP
jgi:hypothetical protein